MSSGGESCTFDRSDHPAVIPKECYALVSPRIDGYDFSKCLMDGGASTNIMYLETLEKMNLTKEQLKHSTTEFHGVVPVVPFKSSYHVIFGRPTYHKFHARACYIYNKLKIPVLTATSRGGSDRDATTKKQISEQKTSFKAAIETKKHDLIEGDNSKQVPHTNERCSGAEGPNWPNVHAYVDDIAVMTRKGSDLLSDLKETFDNLRRRKLRHYFQEHPMTVVSKAPLATIINNSDATGHVAKWGIELSAFDINYEARTAIKSQVLADFIADWTEAPEGTLCRNLKLGSCTLTDPSNIKARGLESP
ncbi:hypothetical protein QYE76_053502 [Lolium multiflorum]|uniref:Gag-pol polyprotein n=1 Tax=Lolium multiflorum TaxID=4521 RepID=A0AAD8SXK9_LOLMU|nr:hypothetical protein QYE76_053502 [Lolium multiflorum]